MPYVHDVGYVLSVQQEELKKSILGSYFKTKEMLSKLDRWKTKHPLGGYRIGWVNNQNIRYLTSYVPNYGVVCHRLATTNGSAWELASACRDGAVWEEDIEEIKLDE